MRILVTGGAGFIGSWISERLTDKGYSVLILDNFSEGKIENILHLKDKKHLKIIRNDIRNKELLFDLMRDIDVCIHAAAVTKVDESIKYPAMYHEINVEGTLNLLKAALKYDTRFIFSSTCLIYDLATIKPINEEHKLKPSSPYAASKIAAENFVEAFFHAYKLPCVILRPFNTYGPRQSSGRYGGVVARFIVKAIDNQPLLIYGTGNQTRDLLYVEDCADAFVLSVENERTNGKILNIGSGKDIPINELGRLIISLTNSNSNLTHVEHPHPQSEIMKLCCDFRKAKDILGWQPKTDLQDGLRKTIPWYRMRKVAQ